MEFTPQPHPNTRQHRVKTFLHQGFLVTGEPLGEAEIADLVDALDGMSGSASDRRSCRRTDDGGRTTGHVGSRRHFGLS